jgi:peptide/nickel transport system substrate-binding protein
VILEANDNYWDPHYPKVQRLVFENTLIGNREEAMRLCREEEGRADIVSHIRPLDTLKVAQSPFAKVVKSRDVIHFGSLFNQRKRGSKWRDIRLRRALNYAINREELWKYAAKGNAYNLGGIIPPGVYGHNPDLTLYTYDTERARSLLAEAGYPDGFELIMITHEAWKLEAQIVSKMLERIGLKAKLEVLSLPQFAAKLLVILMDKPPEEQEWDITIGHYENAWGHPEMLLGFELLEGAVIPCMEIDPVYQEMWKEMARTVSRGAREAKVRELYHYMYDRAYRVAIYSPLSLYAVNKEVNLVPYKSSRLNLKETSVTDNHWSVREENQ